MAIRKGTDTLAPNDFLNTSLTHGPTYPVASQILRAHFAQAVVISTQFRRGAYKSPFAGHRSQLRGGSRGMVTGGVDTR